MHNINIQCVQQRIHAFASEKKRTVIHIIQFEDSRLTDFPSDKTNPRKVLLWHPIYRYDFFLLRSVPDVLLLLTSKVPIHLTSNWYWGLYIW
jgi:hypothetical protein